MMSLKASSPFSSSETCLALHSLQKCLDELKLFDLLHKKHLSTESMVHCTQWKQWLEQNLRTVYEDIASGTTELRILEQLERLTTSRSNDLKTLREYETIKETSSRVLTELDRQKLENDGELAELNKRISELKDQLEWEMEKSKATLDYCKNHEEKLMNELREKLSAELGLWDERAGDLERKIHQTTEDFATMKSSMCMDIENTQDKLSALRVKYASEKTRAENEIQQMESEFQDLVQQQEEMIQSFQEKKAVVDEYEAYLRAQEEAARLVKTVIRLQAWWKGTLTRRRILLEQKLNSIVSRPYKGAGMAVDRRKVADKRLK